ncbi:692_t:CDS:10 [Paraglomus occultum]|uniref:692_t:CDS:1 n=1 Tax=Paraglomus occultum TaxID=144539 RepID=A0A9N8WCG9_9GLOM|nr:692_t:CDS:10 [Paraglomus occultum]
MAEYNQEAHVYENTAPSSVSEIFSNVYGSKPEQFLEIPNLYKLAELYMDEDSAQNIVIQPSDLKKICNLLAPGSYHSVSDIGFEQLARVPIRLIGCYGNREVIFKWLLQNNVMGEYRCKESVKTEREHETVYNESPTPGNGFYLLMLKPDLGLVILWSEERFYRENNATELYQFLARLTEHQFCLMSESDLKNFNWNLISDSGKQTLDESVNHKIEEEQKKDIVMIENGFEIRIPALFLYTQDPSKAYIIESTTLQSIAIVQYFDQSTIFSQKIDTFDSLYAFQQFWRPLVNENCYALSAPNLSIDGLTILIKDGLNQPDLLEDYENQLKDLHNKTEKNIDEYKKKVTEWALSILQDNYRISEKKTEETSINSLEDSPELNKFYTHHKELCKQIKNMALRIDSKDWKSLKERFFYLSGLAQGTCDMFLDIIITDAQENSLPSKKIEEINSAMQKVATCFMNQANPEEECDQKSKEIFEEAKKMADKISDPSFITYLHNLQKLTSPDTVMEGIIAEFVKEIHNCKPKFEEKLSKYLEENTNLKDNYKYFKKYTREKGFIIEDESAALRTKLESLYFTGSKLVVTNLRKLPSDQYELHYTIEIDEPSLYELKIWDLNLEKYKYSSNNAMSSCLKVLYIDKEMFEIRQVIRKIYQFTNGKLVLILWDKRYCAYAMFYESLASLVMIFKKKSFPCPTELLEVSEDSLFAVNDSKGLMAIYENKKCMFYIYDFDKDKAIIYIEHLGSLPTIKYFFWINNTRLCLVDDNGQSYYLNLNSNSLQVSTKFPTNATSVLSSPDGSCIFVLRESKTQHKQADDPNTHCVDNETNLSTKLKGKQSLHSQNLNDSMPQENTVQALVYFVNQSDTKPLIVDIPLPSRWLSHCKFVIFEQTQQHLVMFNLALGKLVSVNVRINSNHNMGKVRIDSIVSSLVYGTNTRFIRDVEVGQYIVFNREKRPVTHIFSNESLQVGDGGFSLPLIPNLWDGYKIEEKTTSARSGGSTKSCTDKDIDPMELTESSGYLGAHSKFFAKYPIQPSTNDNTTPIELTVILDLPQDSTVDLVKVQERYTEYMQNRLGDTTEQDTSLLRTQVKRLDDKSLYTDLETFASSYKADHWIIRLCTLMPIQIAVARDNRFIILRDGSQLQDGGNVEEICQSISLGCYEAILKYLGNKAVDVISTMGEQSREKSYLLNQFIGTNFDDFETHSNKGVWLSLAYEGDKVYVGMDFEGLSPLDKTPQENLLLTLFNISVSTMILFTSSFHINKDISDKFDNFGLESTCFGDIKKVENIFQALFYTIVKDVPDVDIETTYRELFEKFTQLVQAEGENNLISKVYGVETWPIPNKSEFYTAFDALKIKLKTEAPKKYNNALHFLTTLKLIMAKLTGCDWASLSEHRFTIARLKAALPNFVAHGHESILPNDHDINEEEFMVHTGKNCVDDKDIPMFDLFRRLKDSFIPLSDVGLVLIGNDLTGTSKILNEYFEKNYGKRLGSNDAKWIELYNKFVDQIINRRRERAETWLETNLKGIVQDHQEVVKLKSELSRQCDLLKQSWTSGRVCNQNQRSLKNRREDSDDGRDHTTNHKRPSYYRRLL